MLPEIEVIQQINFILYSIFPEILGQNKSKNLLKTNSLQNPLVCISYNFR